MKNIAILLKCSGIGDILSSVPSIRFLHNLYNKKIHVFTIHEEVFKNFPYIITKSIEEIKKITDDPEWDIFSTFDLNKDLHPRIDIRQFHASKLGIQLLPEELNIEFYPDKYQPINLPNNYVVIHPVKTWPSRTWEENRWQELTDILNRNNIPVVSVGKRSSEIGTYNTQKPTFNINIKKGLDLLNNTSLHQTWHILNKATVIITMDSGILHLAGTTNTAIIQLGSSIDPRFRAPYRKNTQDYKYSYVSGSCKLLCGSDPKYFIKYNEDFKLIAPIPFCLEHPETIGNQDVNPDIYKCHPPVNKVISETLRMYNIYKKDVKKDIQETLVNNKGSFYL